MKRYASLILLAAAIPLASTEGKEAAGEKWVQLFNGKNLDGWTAKIRGYPAGENFGDTFRVEDGILKVAYDRYEGKFDKRFGHLFYDQPFSSYRLRVEYRFTGEQLPDAPGWARMNSGIMIHGQKPGQMDRDQNFPVSIEVQLLGASGDEERTTANLCTPGTHVVMKGNLVTRHCTDSSSRTYPGSEWVAIEVEVHSNRLIRHIVNGKAVLQYSHPQLDPDDGVAQKLIGEEGKMLKGGTISLQSEGHPVEFRKVELLPLEGGG